MKVIIQQNWVSGLGDLYTGACEYLTFIKKLKDLGYETELIFSLHSGLGGGNKYINECSFDEIFDIDSFSCFDKISTRLWSHTDIVLENLDYKFTSRVGTNLPGVHWWDCFADELPTNSIYQVPWYGSEQLLALGTKPEVTPNFNKEVYRRQEEFLKNKPKEFDFIQFRVADMGNQKLDELIDITNIIKGQIENTDKIFYIGSNHDYFLTNLNLLPNIFIYEYKNLEIFKNDHPYYYYHPNLTKEVYLDRVYDNLTEMTSIKLSNNIYLVSLFGWVSNFLFYGLSKNENANFKRIKPDHNFNL